jgi:hypothetical protein
MPELNGAFLFYESELLSSKIEVRLENESVWLSQNQMAELFKTTRANINIHIKNIFKEGELNHNSVIKDYLHTALIDKKLILSFFVHIFVLINVHKRKLLCLQPVFPISEKTLNGI